MAHQIELFHEPVDTHDGEHDREENEAEVNGMRIDLPVEA
jgi:hypothetical protein